MADINTAEFTSALQEAARAARDLARAHSQQADAIMREHGDALRDLNDVTEQLVDSLLKENQTSVKSNKQAQETIEKIKERNKLEAEYNKLKEEENDLIEQGLRGTEQFNLARARTQAAEGRLNNAREGANNSFKNLQSSVKGFGKNIRWADAAVVWFSNTLTTQGQQLKKQYMATGGVIESSGSLWTALFKQQTEAFKLGLSGEDLQKMSREHRQVINSLGGTTESLAMLDPAMDRFRALTADNTLATLYAMKAAQSFAKLGVKPSEAAISAYTDSVVMLNKRTGMQIEAAMQLYDSVAGDIESIDILRSAREGERQAILASQRALIDQSIAAGMSSEQAERAAKMLNKMVAAKPLDRLKQAAKIRALGGAMGIAGSEEAAQALISGKRDAASKQALATFSQSAANMMDQAAQQGLGTEIFATSLLEKLDLEQYYGKGSDFSTSLGAAMQPTKGILDTLFDLSRTRMGEMVEKLTNILGALSKFTSGEFFAGVIAAGISAAMLKGGLLKKMAAMLGAGGGAAASASGAAPAASKAAKAAGVVKGGAKFLGPVAGLATGAIEYGETGDVGRAVGRGAGTAGGAWAGAASGAAMGSLVGPIGTVVGGVLGAALGGWGGGELGAATGGLFSKKETPVDMTAQSASKKKDQLKEFSDAASSDVNMATLTTADKVTKQVEQLDASNVLLKQLAEMSQRQIELSEKQLHAMTLTEKEKADANTRSNLLQGSKFGSQYSYGF